MSQSGAPPDGPPNQGPKANFRTIALIVGAAMFMEQLDGTVLATALPLTLRLPDLPALAPGTRVRLAVGAIDLLAETIECRFAGAVETAGEAGGMEAAGASGDAEPDGEAGGVRTAGEAGGEAPPSA